jgi:hypothetical protein
MGPRFFSVDHPRPSLRSLSGSDRLQWGHASSAWITYSFGFIKSDGAWKPVKSVADAGEAETWNIHVLEDESYTAEGCIVKNCPLQMGVIKRAIDLWTNPGDVVLTPFAGIAAEVVGAIQLGHRGIGIELKDSYFKTGCQNCRIEESHIEAPRLDLESALPSLDDVIDAEFEVVADDELAGLGIDE